VEEKTDEIGAKFEHSARKPLRDLAQESVSSSFKFMLISKQEL
jgi:hypothetical protein